MEKDLKQILLKYGLNLKKNYGQNFLSDETFLDKIVELSNVSSEDTVLEIGCGAGTLTRALAKKAKRVIGYEIDTRLKPILDEVKRDNSNVEIVFNDIMKEKISDIEKKIGTNYIIVANLPYYITTPILMNFIENAKNVSCMVVMVQKEVALRLASKPATSDYGAITVAINLRGSAKIILEAPRQMFIPVPNVDSAVVKIDIEKDKFKGVDLTKVRDVVRIAFTNRRKMLVNNLMTGYKLNREQCLELLAQANISNTVRGETLSAQDFVNLASKIGEINV